MSGTSVVPYQQKKKAVTPSCKTFHEIHPPVDFSFFEIANFADVADPPRQPVSPRGKGKQQEPAEGEQAKFSGQVLKLNNNNISNLESLISFAQHKFTNWQQIGMIDLSCNELTTIGPELTEFVNLQILYLHGNQIADPANIDQLQPLENLKKLSLHGNPIENMKGCRWFVLSRLPRLQSFNFSRITKAERKTSTTWERMNCWGQKKKKKVDDDDD